MIERDLCWHVRIVDDAMPRLLCDALVAYYAERHQPVFDEPWRRCGAVTVPDDARFFGELIARLSGDLGRYRDAEKIDALNHVREVERPQVFGYLPRDPRGPNRFHRHTDAWNVSTASRAVSAIYYLDDVAKGGETRFFDLGLSVKPVKGRAIFFPSSWLYEHEGLQPISGPKHVLVAWFHLAGYDKRVETIPL